MFASESPHGRRAPLTLVSPNKHQQQQNQTEAAAGRSSLVGPVKTPKRASASSSSVIARHHQHQRSFGHNSRASLDISKDGRAAISVLTSGCSPHSSASAAAAGSASASASATTKRQFTRSSAALSSSSRRRAATVGQPASFRAHTDVFLSSASAAARGPSTPLQQSRLYDGLDSVSYTAARRQSASRVELDDVESLLRKYTALGNPFELRGGAQTTSSFPSSNDFSDDARYSTAATNAGSHAVAADDMSYGPCSSAMNGPDTPRRSLPMLSAPKMERSRASDGRNNNNQPFSQAAAASVIPSSSTTTQQFNYGSSDSMISSLNGKINYNPFPYASVLDSGTQLPFFYSSGPSSPYTTNPSSLSSSLASSRSNTYAQLPAPLEKLNTMIMDLQSFLPQAVSVPQYKLDQLQQAVDQLVLSAGTLEAHAPRDFELTSSR